MQRHLLYHIFRETLRSIDDFAITLFKSPWARRKSDEEFFKATLLTLGNLVKDDIKLGTLYATLVLITPEDEKVNHRSNNTSFQLHIILYRTTDSWQVFRER